MKRVIKNIGFSWSKRIVIFLSVFGGIWLILEPLNAFNLFVDYFKTSGVWGYLALIIISIMVTVIVELIFKSNQISKYEFVNITVELVRDGSRHKILAPFDIKISSFLIHLADFLKIEHNYNILDRLLGAYVSSISVKRYDVFEPLSKDLTLREAGLVNGDLCRIIRYTEGSGSSGILLPLIVQLGIHEEFDGL